MKRLSNSARLGLFLVMLMAAYVFAEDTCINYGTTTITGGCEANKSISVDVQLPVDNFTFDASYNGQEIAKDASINFNMGTCSFTVFVELNSKLHTTYMYVVIDGKTLKTFENVTVNGNATALIFMDGLNLRGNSTCAPGLKKNENGYQFNMVATFTQKDPKLSIKFGAGATFIKPTPPPGPDGSQSGGSSGEKEKVNMKEVFICIGIFCGVLILVLGGGLAALWAVSRIMCNDESDENDQEEENTMNNKRKVGSVDGKTASQMMATSELNKPRSVKTASNKI